ncbi:protein NRT1/ PTR FAMILY 1.2 [Arachis duranensis]|uniref:Protein NRT1/ PTR FAMILY 1.2 n=1 Tax=Arachis duranensis TaxID=130453 RepID=A0A9C6TMY4_ARADU|nr:protein NRT1/ PTR FAMILY 1.2 [Arachis duranensis]
MMFIATFGTLFILMGSFPEIEHVVEVPLLSKATSTTSHNHKGGFRTLPFIIANEAFERLASIGLMPNMILYLTREYGMETAAATNFLLLWSAATNFTPLIAALLADSCVGRYSMIAFGSVTSLLGMVLLWSTTMIPRQTSNQLTNVYNSTSTMQLLILHSSFALMAIGAGGIRSSSLAFGVDQLSMKDKDGNVKESYFGWYYASVTLSILLGLTGVVYIQETMGWKVGFGIPVILMFISTISFFLASPFYVKLETKKNMVSGLAQVIVASYRNRLVQLNQEYGNLTYYHEKDSILLVPSESLRFLNKACMIKDPSQDLKPDGRPLNPWNLCTVDQVEELKALHDYIAIVENIRRGIAIDQGYSEQPQAVVNLSALWLLPRQILDGLAEASACIGQNEFFLAELPQSMSSLASTLGGLAMSVGNLAASFVLSGVDGVTGGGGNESWLSSNINKGHYDYYYAFIFSLCIANFGYFIYCSKAYGPCKGNGKYNFK